MTPDEAVAQIFLTAEGLDDPSPFYIVRRWHRGARLFP